MNYSSPVIASILFLTLTFSNAAHAQYTFKIIDRPGSIGTETFGINHSKVVGTSFDGSNASSFIYDIDSETFEALEGGFFPVAINNSGAMAGGLAGFDNLCALRPKQKKGKNNNNDIQLVSAPTPGARCITRGLNEKGQVSGFEIGMNGQWLGFIYDSKKDSYQQFLPSPRTFAAQINAQGEVAGSVALEADAAFPGSAPGRYGYVRNKNGTVKYFSIAQAETGQTNARGISESGLVAGFYNDTNTGRSTSFVTRLDKGNAFQEVVLEENEIMYQSPCNADLPPAPGPDYLLFTDINVQKVRNDGVAVGTCFDVYFNPATRDAVVKQFGFIASPDE